MTQGVRDAHHRGSQPKRRGTVAREPWTKSLTLRLSEAQYERLRRFAFEQRLNHQDIIEGALMAVLDRQERNA
jgi:predicted DNA binding CopG/RHH family protein